MRKQLAHTSARLTVKYGSRLHSLLNSRRGAPPASGADSFITHSRHASASVPQGFADVAPNHSTRTRARASVAPCLMSGQCQGDIMNFQPSMLIAVMTRNCHSLDVCLQCLPACVLFEDRVGVGVSNTFNGTPRAHVYASHLHEVFGDGCALDVHTTDESRISCVLLCARSQTRAHCLLQTHRQHILMCPTPTRAMQCWS